MASWLGRSTPKLQVASSPSKDHARTNRVYLSLRTMTTLNLQEGQPLELNGMFVYPAENNPSIADNFVGLNAIQRRELRVSFDDQIPAVPFSWPGSGAKPVEAGAVTFEVDFATKKGSDVELLVDDLEGLVQKRFTQWILSPMQSLILDLFGTSLTVKVTNLVGSGDATVTRASLVPETATYFVKAQGTTLRIKGGDKRPKEIFKADFNFEKMGIGGLDNEFQQIFRRAFASRVFPPAVIQKLGINHVKGMLLYGPPGTGKTLIARQIGKMLNGKEPKVVNGPEILNKYVGQSEENIRNLFKDAESEQNERGSDSELHIIIFDEIDAICKQRGSSRDGTGVGDTVVNQLLSKIDGINALNNILVIGMTNRKDMIDEALMRPGRLEVHVEISLPDEGGRVQILRIHTSKMRDNQMLHSDVDVPGLAAKTKNYSGAELEGVCRSAAAFALNRHVDPSDLKKQPDATNMQVSMGDFKRALEEVQPAFGMGKDDFRRCLLGGFIEHGTRTSELLSAGNAFRDEVRDSDKNPLLSVLIEGLPGTGKTALAARLAVESSFPFVRFVSPEHFVGQSEAYKIQTLAKIFDDAHKSPLSVIVLDNIERMMEYASIGPRFSNSMLQTLLILIKQIPPAGRRLLVLATTSSIGVMESLDVRPAFNAVLSTEVLNRDEITRILEGNARTSVLEVQEGGVASMVDVRPVAFNFQSPQERHAAVEALHCQNVGIKKLLMLLEMSKQEGNLLPFNRLSAVLRDVA